MKNAIKVFGIVTLAVMISFAMMSCGDDPDDPPDGDGGPFTSISAFKTYLDGQPANTAATTYPIVLNISDLGGSSTTAGSLGNTLYTNNTKFVSLDLSGSTFTSIASSAFYGCTGLTSVTVASGNPNYTSQDGIVYNKAKTEIVLAASGISGSVTIPDGVTTIGNSAFQGCTGLTSVTIPDGVTSIASSAFFGCTGLTSVTIGSGVTSIAGSAFYGCTGLTSVTIPAGVTTIDSLTFYRCTGLTSVTIPAGVTSISSSAFQGCTGLTSITVDSNNQNYASQDNIVYNKEKTTLFFAAGGISSVTIPDGVTTIGNSAFDGCTSLTSIDIPDGVTEIGNYAFYNCTGLTSVTIGSGVTGIGSSAFSICESLTSVTIPAGVTSIGDRAFANCYKLTGVIFEGADTTIQNENSFVGGASLKTAYEDETNGGEGTYTQSGDYPDYTWAKE